ncbi:PAS domain S-box protein [Undibacterium sp.]|uniref:hybrid sensor histidine kinase/response regulator n=1 Tax=Undibacterium sp. TaxID=1914977 RepID=UPI00374DC693
MEAWEVPSADDLFEHAACGLLVTTTEGTIRKVNATFCRWIGFSAEELVGKYRFQWLVTVGGRLFHQTHLEPLLQIQRSVSEVQLNVRHKSGHAIPMLVNVLRKNSSHGAYDEIAVFIATDRRAYEQELLSERKKLDVSLKAQLEAQQALQESRDVLGVAIRGVNMGFWTKDFATHNVWWSREMEELLGVADQHFAGTNDAFLSLIHPDDRKSFVQAVEVAQVEATDYVIEFRILHGNGKWIPLEGRGRAVYDKSGKPLTLFGIVSDITDRKEAETVLLRQAAIFEHQSDAIIVVDLNADIVDFNPECVRMLGYSQQEAIGKPVSMLHRQVDFERIQKAFTDGIEKNLEWRGEIIFVRKDGTEGVCESVIKAIANGKGEIYGAISVSRDISERRIAESQLLQLNEQLSKADQRKDEFLATLAHELRNPLAPMRNMLEILKLKNIEDPQLHLAREVFERQVKHMTHLVDDLMDVSRITQGRIQLRREAVDLFTAMQNAVESARTVVDAAQHALIVTPPPETMILFADVTRLTQIIANLLTNAAKYTPNGGHIWLKTERLGNRVVISVRDTGIGIAEDHLPTIFEMFSQLSPALERSQGGLGIGLSLVRGLVELHGGTIEAKSAGIGKGSEFLVSLPLSELQIDVAPSTGQPIATAKHGGRIVVIDDNIDAADTLTMALEMLGYEVFSAHTGTAGVEAITQFCPDVALVDIGLPDINGYEVARQVRASDQGKNIFLIAATGWGQPQDRKTAASAGFDQHLTKPIDFYALDEILKEKINSH